MKSNLKMRSGLLVLLMVGLIYLPAHGANLPKTGLASSTHNIGGIGCKGCHAQHNGALANGGSTGSTGLILLWARNFPAAGTAFGVYDSATMQNKAAELNTTALTVSTDVRMYSLLCLSCHDGVTSSFSPTPMQSANMVGARSGSVYNSYGLTNDHPVNMNYDPTRNTSLQPVATVATALPLYGSTNSLQCGTCHEPHNNTNTNYLRMANNTSLCTTCHI